MSNGYIPQKGLDPLKSVKKGIICITLIINTLAQLVDLQCLKKFFIEYQHVSKTGPKIVGKILGYIRNFYHLYYIRNERNMGKNGNILIINELENSLLSINTLAKSLKKKLLKNLDISNILRIFII